ncbi:MAG: amino acid adenylation domain-containing protein, partial [Thermoleophilaceae bacterium]
TLNLTSYSRLPVHEDVGRVIGDFTSLTLLEVDGQGERFADRARRLQAQLWRDLEHRRVNGVEVLRELARRRGRRAAAMPVVFTSTLGLEHEGSGFPLEELGELVYAVSQTPQVWLDHQVVPRGDGVELSWDAVEELFPDGFLDAMFESYRALVERLADDPGVLDESDPVELPAEQQRAVAAANDTAVELGTARLEDGFLARAAADPDAIAVFDGETTLTYAELERLSGAVAERVAARGELVAVSMRKGWEQVAAVLGVLRAGAAYVPIDPDQPPDRVARLLERVEARVVLTQPELVEQIAWPAGVDPIAIDEHGSGQAPDPGGGPDDLAYVIFTSGSTGEPKGVMIDHGAALNTVLDINRRFEVNARDRVLALSALSFDLSVWDVFGTLAAGATIVVPDPDGTRDPAHWVALAQQERVTVWNSVPALMRLALEHAAAQRTRLPDSLRLVMLSGDWIPLDLPGQLAEYSNARLISLGGATEASIWSIHHPVGGSLDGWDSIPYGDPLANQRWHVLDRRGRECPDWVTGELHIAGDGLALGYWRDPDRTDTAFITREGERLYRTGDLGRRRPGATIEFLGRSDDQVKVNGFRIELGEIEAALTGHPKIVQAVCAAPGPREERRLAAYYMTNAEPPAPAELRNHLAEILPQWMIPTTYTPIESLPLTANGKLDRSRLPDPLQPAAPVATDDDPVSVIVADAMQNGQAGPLSTASVLSLVERARDELAGEVSLEDVLVAAISERLRAHVASLTGSEVEAISVGAPLNTIGLDSLKALELGNKLVDETGVELPLGMVADGLALGEIAARLAPAVAANFGLGDAEVDAGDGDEPRPTLVPAPVDAFEPFPLNPIQEAYWIGRRPELELGGVSCHLHLEFDCTGLDVGRLGRAMRGLVARHGMLRAVVDEDGSQRVLEGVSDYEPVVVDLRDRDDVEPELRRLREAWSHEVRPAGEWPLFEFRVVRTDENRARLFVSLDLLPADGASLFQLGRELSALYSDPAAQLEPVGVSFRDYVLAERELRGGSRWQRDWDYWSSRLDALPAAPDLPLARDVSEVGEARFERRSVVLDGERWRQLRDRASAAGLTASGLLSAAFAEVLGSFSGGGPFTLNLTSYSRLPVHEDVGRVIGDFTSLTLLQVDGEGERFLDRARRLQTQLWRDLEHRRVNGVELLRELARRRGRRAAAMPVVFTSTLGLEQEGSGFPLEELGELVYAVSQTPQVWLDHQVVERGDGVELSWDVVEHLFPDGFLDAMFESYRALVERLADDPGVLEESDPIELPGEQRRMVAAAKETAGGLDRSRVADPERPRTTTGRQGPPPGSSERLAELVAAALGVDEVDPAASLLDLGATSLQLVRLQAAIRAELGVEIGLDELFVAASVNDIGEILVVPIPQ